MRESLLESALRKIARICDSAQDAEGALRQIKQIVGIALPGDYPLPESQPEETGVSYVINLGRSLQVVDNLTAYINGTELQIDQVQITLSNDAPAKVILEYSPNAQRYHNSGGDVEQTGND